MLEIFICEDDEEQRKRLTKYVTDYIMIENLDMKVVVSTAHSNDIIEYLQQNNTTGLYFWM